VQSRGSSSEFCGEEEKEEEAPDLPFCIAYLSIYLPIYLSTDLYNNNNPFPLLSRILDDDLRGRELLQLVPAIILACKQL
jgi:hypothetical protein